MEKYSKRNEIITKEIQLKIKKLLRAVIEEGTGINASKIPINILGKTGTSQRIEMLGLLDAQKDL